MTISSSRREFLAASAGTALASLATIATASTPAPPITDTHVHLWDLKALRLAWLKGAPTLNRSFLWDDYRKVSAGLNIVKAIYIEVDVDPSQQEQEAHSIAELCGRGETYLAGAVISGRPASERFAEYLRPLAKDPAIRGVRQVLHAAEPPPGFCLSPSFIRGIRLLGELEMSFDLCMRPGELSDWAKLIEACPSTQFVLDHCGNADVFAADLTPWKRGIAGIAERSNACCKVSGIVASTKGREWRADDLAPIINHVLDEFGPDRVVFGGDWPVCTLGTPLARWVEALLEVVRDRTPDDQRKLFHDNAKRVYRIN
jgi:L-fuconolactonase